MEIGLATKAANVDAGTIVAVAHGERAAHPARPEHRALQPVPRNDRSGRRNGRVTRARIRSR
jgi:hypothetical protein